MTDDDYRLQLRALLPRGFAWVCVAGGILDRLLLAFGGGLARVDAFAEALVNEADPRTSSELLSDWERVCGLAPASLTVAQRRAAVAAQLAAVGGQNWQYYEALISAMGYTASITEYRPHTVESGVDFPLYGWTWAFHWRIRAHAESSAVPQASLEALIGQIAPAHTIVVFEYY